MGGKKKLPVLLFLLDLNKFVHLLLYMWWKWERSSWEVQHQ